MKSALSNLIVHAKPASSGVVESLASRPEQQIFLFQPQRAQRAEAAGADAKRASRREDTIPDVLRVLDRVEELVAELAGVAGAGQ